MDIIKLEGLISAIESESRQPSPSHNNLARLVAMFCKELIKQSEKPSTETISSIAGNVETVQTQEDLDPKKAKINKKGKR